MHTKHVWVIFDSYFIKSGQVFKVIPQKLKLPKNSFETFPESSLLGTVSKKIIMIGHHSRLRWLDRIFE